MNRFHFFFNVSSSQQIWTVRCHVEMYGSCATQLDLPSSDLDVVVRGFDVNSELNDGHEASTGDRNVNNMSDRQHIGSTSPSRVSYLGQNHFYHSPLTPNGNRVVRLAEELERQAWAVQIKAIPTASVPVIKILADANRLTGAVSGMNWMLHQQQLSVADVVSEDVNSATVGSNLSNNYSLKQF